MTGGVIAAGSLLKYLQELQKTSLEHMTKLEPYSTSRYMVIDSSTRRNLELVETLREKQKRGDASVGCWIRPKQPWGRGCSAAMWNSR